MSKEVNVFDKYMGDPSTDSDLLTADSMAKKFFGAGLEIDYKEGFIMVSEFTLAPVHHEVTRKSIGRSTKTEYVGWTAYECYVGGGNLTDPDYGYDWSEEELELGYTPTNLCSMIKAVILRRKEIKVDDFLHGESLYHHHCLGITDIKGDKNLSEQVEKLRERVNQLKSYGVDRPWATAL